MCFSQYSLFHAIEFSNEADTFESSLLLIYFILKHKHVNSKLNWKIALKKADEGVWWAAQEIEIDSTAILNN